MRARQEAAAVGVEEAGQRKKKQPGLVPEAVAAAAGDLWTRVAQATRPPQLLLAWAEA